MIRDKNSQPGQSPSLRDESAVEAVVFTDDGFVVVVIVVKNNKHWPLFHEALSIQGMPTAQVLSVVTYRNRFRKYGAKMRVGLFLWACRLIII